MAWIYLKPHHGKGFFWQCLHFSWTTLRDKYCWHPIAVMGVVETFGHGRFSSGLTMLVIGIWNWGYCLSYRRELAVADYYIEPENPQVPNVMSWNFAVARHPWHPCKHKPWLMMEYSNLYSICFQHKFGCTFCVFYWINP